MEDVSTFVQTFVVKINFFCKIILIFWFNTISEQFDILIFTTRDCYYEINFVFYDIYKNHTRFLRYVPTDWRLTSSPGSKSASISRGDVSLLTSPVPNYPTFQFLDHVYNHTIFVLQRHLHIIQNNIHNIYVYIKI